MVNNLIARLWPSCCLLCGQRAAGPLDLCDGCADELPWLDQSCDRCGVPLPSAGSCGSCLQRPPPFNCCRAPLRYEAPVDHLVTRFKYGGHASAGNLLAQLLIHHLRETRDTSDQAIDALIPMPLHWRRRWSRGFNQAAVLADSVGSALGIPVWPRILRRLRPTPPQQGLTAPERRRNLRGAFVAAPAVTGRRLVLLDDVVTTASSASEATRALLAAGAASVELWCVARTP